jgi:hypothetical protein
MALPRNTMLRGKRARRRDYLALAISGTQAQRLPEEITDAVSYPISNLQNYGENHVNGRIAVPSHRVRDQEFDRRWHLPSWMDRAMELPESRYRFTFLHAYADWAER